MKYFIFVVALTLAFSACSGEYYELKKSPCACDEIDYSKLAGL